MRATLIGMLVIASLVATQLPALGDDDKLKEIPESFRGTWLLRLTSDDGGKTYKSGGNKAICDVTAGEVAFKEKVDYSDEKLKVKSVEKKEENKVTSYMVKFDNGKAWKLYELSGSLTATIYDVDGEKLTEKYRITCRKEKK